MFTDDRLEELRGCLEEKLVGPVDESVVNLIAEVWKAGFNHCQSGSNATSTGGDGLAALLSVLKNIDGSASSAGQRL